MSKKQTFTEQCADMGITVTGNDSFNKLEEMVSSGDAETPGEALAKMLSTPVNETNETGGDPIPIDNAKELIKLHFVYNILVSTCEASPLGRFDFLQHFPKCQEYRFQGALGFGGKIYAKSDGSMYVSCYAEDVTPTITKMMTSANKKLTTLLGLQ